MMGFEEDDFDEDGKFVLEQIKAIKAGKPLDVKKLAPIIWSDDLGSNTEVALFKLAETAKRKGDKPAKQLAALIQATFEKHVVAIAKKPRRWISAGSRGDEMKILKADIAFAEPLLDKAMKARGVDKDFLSDLILMVLQQDKKRGQRMYDKVQEAAKTKPEWVFKMPFRHPARR
jgi:hypothetical protein